jgi:hypothetical protein
MLRAVAFVGALVLVPVVAAAQQPCTTDARLVVNELYRQVLERSADRGSNDFVQRLNMGELTVREAVRAVAKSAEHSRRFLAGGSPEANRQAVTHLYQHLLDRSPDQGGLESHSQAMASYGVGQVIDTIVDSEEYRRKYGEDGVPGSSVRFCGPRTATPRDRPDVSDNRQIQNDPPLFGFTAADFADIDFNRDGRIAVGEWNYSPETFRRVDRNRDGVVSRPEFLAGETVVDEDAFTALDANGNNRIERREWDGTAAEFDQLDANRNNILTRAELRGRAGRDDTAFTSVDLNRDGRITINEWNGNRRSFDRQDANGDGVITRREFAGGPAPTTGR